MIFTMNIYIIKNSFIFSMLNKKETFEFYLIQSFLFTTLLLNYSKTT
jgi:hypothetical protein